MVKSHKTRMCPPVTKQAPMQLLKQPGISLHKIIIHSSHCVIDVHTSGKTCFFLSQLHVEVRGVNNEGLPSSLSMEVNNKYN